MTRRYTRPEGAHYLVCVDPGVHKCAISVWGVLGDKAELLRAALVDSSEVTLTVSLWCGGFAVAWVVEKPHYRRDQRSKDRDIDRLLAVVEVIRTTRQGKSTYRAVKPSPWKGSLPKEVHHARVAGKFPALKNRVSPEAPTYDHNIADAVCLGLWALGWVGRGGAKNLENR